MISPILFLLFSTAFSASVPIVKRDTDASTAISGNLTMLSNSITVLSDVVAQLSAQDPSSIVNFKQSLTDFTTHTFRVGGEAEAAIIAHTGTPDVNETQAQQLKDQTSGLSYYLIQLVQNLLQKKNDIDASNATCFVQQIGSLLQEGVIVLIPPIIIASPEPGNATNDLIHVVTNLALLQNLRGQSSCNVKNEFD